MKFSAFKEFRINASGAGVEEYLNTDMTKTLRELGIGLRRLSIDDNFDSFVTTVTIPATTELAIRNELTLVPRYKLILRGKSGAQDVVDGDAEWNQNYVYLKNLGASPVTLTVAFFR